MFHVKHLSYLFYMKRFIKNFTGNLRKNKDGRTEKRRIGDRGEDVACRYLKKHKYAIVERNYLKKWGEIDVIAKKEGVLHFVEVKSVSCLPRRAEGEMGKTTNRNVPRENFWPEENVDARKFRRIARAVQTYLEERNVSKNMEWQIDVITVILNMETRRARVTMIDNVIMDGVDGP